jgi:hypothetical protein
MDKNQRFTNLEELLVQVEKNVQDSDVVTLDKVLQAVGRRSFGALLFTTGIITLAPLIGDIPGVPTIMGMIVFLISIQLLIQRKNLWLPEFLLNNSIKRDKLNKALKKMKSPVRFIDRLLKPRLSVLTEGYMIYVIAVTCLCLSTLMPLMEFVPFSANIAGIVLTVFGLSLLTKDGLLVLIVYIFIGIVIGFIT